MKYLFIRDFAHIPKRKTETMSISLTKIGSQ